MLSHCELQQYASDAQTSEQQSLSEQKGVVPATQQSLGLCPQLSGGAALGVIVSVPVPDWLASKPPTTT